MAQLNDLIVTGSSRFLNKIQGTAASADSATTAARLNNTAAIGSTTSPVYFNASGVPVALNGAAITVNNATNASKTGGVAFGSLATVSTITSGMLPTHNHTTAQITNFTSAVDERITRNKILGTISIASSWTGNYSVVEGTGTTASGDYSHAEGQNTRASGFVAHSEGLTTKATSTAAHAEGSNTTASGKYSHAEGYDTKSTADCAHSEGYESIAYGENSHAEGEWSFAIGESSHAEGVYSRAESTAAHAEGYHTTAFDKYSHSEGYYTSAASTAAHAEGYQTTASGTASHAGGYITIANRDYQTAIGKCNATVSDALFIVGNGRTTAARHNALYVTNDGIFMPSTYSEGSIDPYIFGVKFGNFGKHVDLGWDWSTSAGSGIAFRSIYDHNSNVGENGGFALYARSPENCYQLICEPSTVTGSIGQLQWQYKGVARGNVVWTPTTVHPVGSESQPVYIDNYGRALACTAIAPVPLPTTTDGTYTLQCVVSGGSATYSWVVLPSVTSREW